MWNKKIPDNVKTGGIKFKNYFIFCRAIWQPAYSVSNPEPFSISGPLRRHSSSSPLPVNQGRTDREKERGKTESKTNSVNKLSNVQKRTKIRSRSNFCHVGRIIVLVGRDRNTLACGGGRVFQTVAVEVSVKDVFCRAERDVGNTCTGSFGSGVFELCVLPQVSKNQFQNHPRLKYRSFSKVPRFISSDSVADICCHTARDNPNWYSGISRTVLTNILEL
ncbi:hypothetical protein CEXT_727081 [Caerostris extrusa]|uniref:Uncharacterized protein n=1 Tax=Caerostris extrusa TaxID=172846 RepID=A0AAV4N9Z3_CAEEX|nr:hypothetical protein CEXT_727081 [Caerostris extrusa]